MSSKKQYLLVIICLLVAWPVLAQVSISYPFDGAVFQRNTSNQAGIPVGGSYSSAVDRIEARVVAVAGGTTTAWTTVQDAPTGGVFRGILSNVQGGWYMLEVRAVLFNNVTHTASLSRVGVGEVFMIAGQSNGQGLYNRGSLPSADGHERVKYVPWLLDCPSATCPNAEPPFPQIASLNTNANSLSIAPNGRSAWAYGELGDALIARYNVPVIFFNAAADGSSLGNWSRSADGLPSAHVWTGAQFANNPNFPYYGLRKALNYYGNMLGVRAVLWHQGESDNLKNHNGDPNDNTSSTEYLDSLYYLIGRSRGHTLKFSLAWAVARVSYWAPGGPTDANVIAGQNLAINPANKVFAGPETDNIQVPRTDGVHFENVSGGVQGVSQVAAGWNTALDNTFFNDATPYAGAALPTVTLGCSGGTYSITAPGGYQYFWVQNNNDITTAFSNSQTITPGAGTYRVYLKDGVGNYLISQSISVPNLSPQSPTLSSSASNVLPGQSVTLYAQGCIGTVNWSVGATGNSTVQMPTQNTTYTATCSIGSCTSVPANISITACQALVPVTSVFSNGTTLTIKASDAITGESTNKIQSGANITYDAKKAVVLKPGFLADKQSVFLAKVGVGCN